MLRTAAGVTAVLVWVLLLAGTVSAQVQVVGGATYNTYSLDWDGLPPELSGVEFNSGLGAYGGVQYWINDAMAIGAQLDYFVGSGEETIRDWDYDWDGYLDTETYKLNASGIGYLATLAMSVPLNDGVEIRPYVAAGMYGFSMDMKGSVNYTDPLEPDVSATVKFKADNRFGGKAGVAIGLDLAPGLTLDATAAYRYVSEFTSVTMDAMGVETEWDNLKGLNVSGFSVGAAISYAF